MKQLSPARQPLLHGVFAQVESRRYIFDGLMFTIIQNERFAVTFRDALNRTPEDGLFLPADRVIRRQRFRCGRFLYLLQRFGFVNGFPSLLTQRIIGEVA